MDSRETFKPIKRGEQIVKGKKGFQPKPTRVDSNLVLRLTHREKALLRVAAKRKGTTMTNLVKASISSYLKDESISLNLDNSKNQTRLEFREGKG